MPAIDDVLQFAVKSGVARGIVAGTANCAGVLSQCAAGVTGLDGATPLNTDAVFRIFSMTKAVVALAALQLYEEGRLDLDAPVEAYVPDFGTLQVIEGFDGETPRLRPPKRKATVRQLMTHTSGLAYQFWNGDTKKYLEVTGNPGFLSGQKRGLMYPLTFDPGERWHYGISIDWLGLVVEGAAAKSLRTVCREKIFAPLSMRDTDFECEGAARSRLVPVHARGKDGVMTVISLDPPSYPEVYGGGFGLYSTLSDYLTFLVALLNGGESGGTRILKSETLAMALQNHTGELAIPKLETVIPAVSSDAEFFPRAKKGQGLIAMTNLETIPGTLSAGSQFWAGALNTYFWFDPARDIAGVILMQFLPFADVQALQTLVAFQKAVYASH